MTAPVEMILTPDELENQLAYLVHGVSDDRAMAQAKISRHCKDLRAALTARDDLLAECGAYLDSHTNSERSEASRLIHRIFAMIAKGETK